MVYMRTNTPSRLGSRGASTRPRRRRGGDEPKKPPAERILNAEPDDHLKAETAEDRIARGAAISRGFAEQPLVGERKQSLPSFNPAYNAFRKSTSSVFTC
jgi:hypothetical protein